MKHIKKMFEEIDQPLDQISILKIKMDEYNSNKSKLVGFLANDSTAQQQFDNLLKTLKYKDNDLLRYEWAFQKANRDVKKYKDLISKTIVEYNTKKI